MNGDSSSSSIRGAMPGPLGLIVLFALFGLVGLRRASMGLLSLYLATQIVATVAFFVCARYRMTATPALFVFAAYAAVTALLGELPSVETYMDHFQKLEPRAEAIRQPLYHP